jgi:hypothetical protein
MEKNRIPAAAVEELLKRAAELELHYQSLHANLPDSWRSSVFTWHNIDENDFDPGTPVFPGRVDRYPDTFNAAAQNFVRAARIMLLADIVRMRALLCQPLKDYKETQEYLSALSASKKLIEDIIASIPYFLGQLPGAQVSEEGDHYGTSGVAMFASWPLFVVKSSDFTSESQRTWVSGRLEYMANEKGLAQSNRFHSVSWQSMQISIFTRSEVL